MSIRTPTGGDRGRTPPRWSPARYAGARDGCRHRRWQPSAEARSVLGKGIALDELRVTAGECSVMSPITDECSWWRCRRDLVRILGTVTADVTAPGSAHPLTAVGQLVAVNVGLPRDVAWRGRTVHTGIWKRAVEGPRTVRTLNLDGDGQGDLAGHGGPHRAVMVYQLGSYDYWSRQLGRDDFEYGQFGENFTVEGLPDDEVCIGDQFEIGTALFEVSQPRVTCYRVGLRLGQPRLPGGAGAPPRPGGGGSRGCRRCWCHTAGRGSTCGSSARGSSRPATRSSGWQRTRRG